MDNVFSTEIQCRSIN